MSPREIEAAMLALLDQRGTATACPSEIARKIGGADWRARMPDVRAAAIRLQRAGKLDVYQRKKPVDYATARGPVRLRTRDVALDYRTHPERYVVGRGEEGVLTVEPYKSELLPLWRFRTPEIARTSARAIYKRFVSYGKTGDFVGMDMARKFLQMGVTRSRRYANRGHPEKAKSADEFRVYYDRAREHPTYHRLRAAHADRARSRGLEDPADHAADSRRPHRAASRSVPRRPRSGRMR